MTIPTVYGTRVASYPGTLPYSPSEKYPEYPFGDIGAETNLRRSAKCDYGLKSVLN